MLFLVCYFGDSVCAYNLAQITGRERQAREEAGMGGPGARRWRARSGQAVAHGFGGGAGDFGAMLPMLQRQRCGYRLAKTALGAS